MNWTLLVYWLVNDLLQVLHLISPLSRNKLAILRKFLNLTGAGDLTLETMQGNAFSSRSGSTPSLAVAPRINLTERPWVRPHMYLRYAAQYRRYAPTQFITFQ